MNMKKRNDAIDILKFLAVVLILNSHFDKIYLPPFDKLATGGTIGDAMFFLCSGFTMLLGGGQKFCKLLQEAHLQDISVGYSMGNHRSRGL